MEYAQTPNSAPLTDKERRESLEMWKRMYERDEDVNIEAAEEAARRYQAKLAEERAKQN